MQNMNESNTPAIDLFSSRDPLLSAKRLRTRVHRWSLTFRRYWWLLPLIAIPLVGGAYYYSAKTPAQFESEAKLWVTGRLNLNEGKVYTEEVGNFIGTQSELLRSKTVQDRALAKVVQQFPTVASQTNFPFMLEVNDSAKSSVFELRAVGNEPESTRMFLAMVVDEYLAFKRETRESTSGRTLTSANAQVRELEQALEREQSKMYAFQQSNNIVFIQEEGNSAGSYLAAINRQLALLRTENQLLELIQPEQFLEMAKNPANNLPPDETLPGQASAQEIAVTMAALHTDYLKATQQLQLLEAKQDELGLYLRPAHPKMTKLSEEIATQERLIDIFRNESASQLANRKEAIRLQIQNLEAARGEWDVKAVEASRKIADLDQIRRNVERLQQSHDRLLGVIQTVDLGKNIGQENVGIMEPASNAKPLNLLLRNIILSVIASLVIAFALFYCITVFDDRFTSVNELDAQLAEPVIGQVPQIAMKNSGRLQLEHATRKHLPFLEAFRNIRSSLLFFGDGSERPKTIVVTSSIPEEGKSTITAYLGTMLALGGARVLVIDADLRQRVLHKFFDHTGTPGLAEVLENKTSLQEAVASTSVPNLHLLPAGQPSWHPGELFLNPRFDAVMRELHHKFDYILVDTPPVLAADDATTLAPKMDCALYVVRAAFTSGRLTEQGLSLLRHRGVKILGLILNRTTSGTGGHHSYGKYNGSYAYEGNALPVARQEA
jgi:succinoglycan biosynthesis transport protein ExoP